MKSESPDPWLRLTVALALLLPFLVLHRTFLRPTTHLVAARPNAWPLDDPTTNATAMARAWASPCSVRATSDQPEKRPSLLATVWP